MVWTSVTYLPISSRRHTLPEHLIDLRRVTSSAFGKGKPKHDAGDEAGPEKEPGRLVSPKLAPFTSTMTALESLS